MGCNEGGDAEKRHMWLGHPRPNPDSPAQLSGDRSLFTLLSFSQRLKGEK